MVKSRPTSLVYQPRDVIIEISVESKPTHLASQPRYVINDISVESKPTSTEVSSLQSSASLTTVGD